MDSSDGHHDNDNLLPPPAVPNPRMATPGRASSREQVPCVNRAIAELERRYRFPIGDVDAPGLSLDPVIRYVNGQLSSGC
jgi:hypothetical protein